MLISVIVFFLIFSFVIVIHELGHFSSARRHGVKVEEFGLGVPPKAISLFKDKQGCEYTLNWIPFGGFVRLEGEDDMSLKTKNKESSFAAKSILARMEIILAGVFMNYVSAILILTSVFMVGSTPILLNQADVNRHIEEGNIILDEGIQVMEVSDGPAMDAGLAVGDLVLEVNQQVISSAKQISDIQAPGVTANYLVLRGEDRLSLGIEADKNGKIGVAFSTFPAFKEVHEISLSLFDAVKYAFIQSYHISTATVIAFKNVILQLVSFNGVPDSVAGPVGIAAMTHNIVETGSIADIFKFTALISLSLAIMNVLPIPALDGGRFVFLLIEAVFRRPVNPNWEVRIHTVSYVLLLLLILFVTGNDIYKLLINVL